VKLKQLALILLITIASLAARGPADNLAAVSMAFGVLGGSCDPGRAAALKQAGVSMVELPLAWDQYMPVRGQVNQRYVRDVESRMETCRATGLKIVLSPGLHYSPEWVRRLPGGTLQGSVESDPSSGEVDLVFSATVREAAGEYLSRVASDLGFGGVIAVRVGTSATGELGFPGPPDGGGRPEFMAFGDAPQRGIGLASGMQSSPLPGWVPGDLRWNGHRLTAREVRAWLTWYNQSAVDAVSWQIGLLRDLGFEGRVHVPVAGRGVLPSEREEAVDALVAGRLPRLDALARGLDYPRQFGLLSRQEGVDIDFTGLDDDTAVRARTADPGREQCQPGDTVDLLTRDDLDEWSSQRFTAAAAQAAGLGLLGENPGDPDAPYTGGSEWSDSLAMQLDMAPAYAVGCGMSGFLFAFEDDLFETGGESTDVDLAAYEARISELRGRE
jgi:hypothetical protein